MIGDELKKLRTERELTQSQLSKATGIPQNTISWLENNKGIANINQCITLADYYEISLDELVGRDFKSNNK